MTLKDLKTMPIQTAIDGMDITELKIHSDNNGVINSIEIKYSDPEFPGSKIAKR